jgi:hypothetical protein
MSDASQRHTDEQRGLADARASLHRYETYEEYAGETPHFSTVGPNVTFTASTPSPVDDWDGWLERRKQIDREEKRAFNEKYGYAQ